MPISRQRALGRAALWLGVSAFVINLAGGTAATLLLSQHQFVIVGVVSLLVGIGAGLVGVTAIILGSIAVMPREESTAAGTARVCGGIGLTAGTLVVVAIVDGLLRGVLLSL